MSGPLLDRPLCHPSSPSPTSQPLAYVVNGQKKACADLKMLCMCRAFNHPGQVRKQPRGFMHCHSICRSDVAGWLLGLSTVTHRLLAPVAGAGEQQVGAPAAGGQHAGAGHGQPQALSAAAQAAPAAGAAAVAARPVAVAADSSWAAPAVAERQDSGPGAFDG